MRIRNIRQKTDSRRQADDRSRDLVRKDDFDPLDVVKESAAPSVRRKPAPLVDVGDGTFVAPGTTLRAHAGVDVCFVFDTTGSMSDKIDGLIACLSEFVDAFSRFQLDWRVSCVPFGDLTVENDRVDSQLPFVAAVDDAKAQLRGMPRFSGGGNYGESSIEAMLAGINKPWRSGAVRVLVLLTDEPALGDERAQSLSHQLHEREIICFVASPNLPYYVNWALSNGGQWCEIGPSMDMTQLLDLLRSLVQEVAVVARDVHTLAAGSVRKYLELGRGGK